MLDTHERGHGNKDDCGFHKKRKHKFMKKLPVHYIERSVWERKDFKHHTATAAHALELSCMTNCLVVPKH